MTDRPSRVDLPQGTLDLLILKAIALGPHHGWAISDRIHQITGDVLKVQQGSLYPSLHRLERRGWIKMAHEFGYDVHAVFFDVPLEVCMERNRKRHRMVPEDVMQRMAQKLRPPSFDEGFSKIIVVRVKKSAAQAAAETPEVSSETFPEAEMSSEEAADFPKEPEDY